MYDDDLIDKEYFELLCRYCKNEMKDSKDAGYDKELACNCWKEVMAVVKNVNM